MSVTGFATLQDLAKFNSWDGTVSRIIEGQTQVNKILEDMIFGEATDGSVLETVLRTSLPSVAWRLINKGVTPDKSGTRNQTFTTGGVEALAKVDERMLEKHGGVDSPKANNWRLGENQAYLQAMNNKMATTLFYGDERTTPAGFTGLNAYLYSLTNSKCSASAQIVDAGATGSNLTSMYFVFWDQNTIHGFYPEGTTGGFKYRDNGRVKSYDNNNGEFYAYESQYNWDLGLAVRDTRYVARIANVDVNNTTCMTNLFSNMMEAYGRIWDPSVGKGAIYANRQVITQLNKQANTGTNRAVDISIIDGKPVTSFWGLPVHRVDALINAESQVTA